MKTKWLVVLLFIFPISLSGQTTGPDYLKFDLCPRAMGMGGAYVAVADDSQALFWNPAGLASVKGGDLTFSHLASFSDATYERLDGAFNLMQLGIGCSLFYSQDNNLTSTNDQGQDTGNIVSYDWMVNLGVAKQWGDYKAGLVVKTFHTHLLDMYSQGVALDGGADYDCPFVPVTVGAAVQNIGSQSALVSGGAVVSLPSRVRMGLMWRLVRTALQDLSLAGEGDVPFSSDDRVMGGIGGEYTWDKMVSVRAGYQMGQDKASYTLGAGFCYGYWRFDYAYAPLDYLGANQWFSLSVRE